MGLQVVRLDRFFPAPPERVFDQFADHAGFGELWGLKVKRIRVGAEPAQPNGLGSVRQIPSPVGPFEETIVGFKRYRLIEYTVSRGGPIKDHLGRIEFSPVPGGTQVSYSIRFAPRFPFTGALIAAILRRDWARHSPRVAARLALA